MKRVALLLPACLLLIVSMSHALDPPVKLWERWYYQSWDGALFYDVEITEAGDLFITGHAYDFTPPIRENYVAYLMNQDGDVLFETSHDLYRAFSYDGDILADGSYIIVGKCLEAPDSSTALYIEKIDQSGGIEWTKVYDYPTTKEEGYGITCLPDGGFAVCGRVNGTGNVLGDAWILRMDANGDTLWTDVWGTAPRNYGKSITYSNGEIVVLTYGMDDTLTTKGIHLLFYDLAGNYIRGTDYIELSTLQYPMEICQASDGGYTFVSKVNPVIWHTDYLGDTIWWQNIDPPPDWHEGHGVRTTMDGGYLFYGWCGVWSEPDSLIISAPVAEVDTGNTQDGWLIRFDSEGNTLWGRQNEMGHSNIFYSAVQLPEGGYIAAGTYTGSGYLVRYAPETGIEGAEPSPITALTLTPNPFSSSLSISYSVPEPAEVKLSVYDLSGRLVENLVSGSLSSGEHSTTWSTDPSLPDGCYLIVLDICGDRVVQRCIKLS